jgi:hypothetical protein
MEAQTARCDECRADLKVPADYAHGDKIRCERCGAQMRVLRGESGPPRLVMADSGPLKGALEQNRIRTAQLQSELQTARHSIGIGINGLGIGVLYVIAKIFLEDQLFTQTLILTAIGIAVLVGVLLELANHLFLAKRTEITRLTGELDAAKQEARQLQSRIREADRPYAKTPPNGGSPRGAVATR